MRDLSRLVEAPLRIPERQERQRGSAPGPERQLSGGIPRTPLERHAGEIIPPAPPLFPPCGFAARRPSADGRRRAGAALSVGRGGGVPEGGLFFLFFRAGRGRAFERGGSFSVCFMPPRPGCRGVLPGSCVQSSVIVTRAQSGRVLRTRPRWPTALPAVAGTAVQAEEP